MFKVLMPSQHYRTEMANETTRHAEVVEVTALRAQLDSANAERGRERRRVRHSRYSKKLSASQDLGFERAGSDSYSFVFDSF